MLDEARGIANIPFHITSGYRCELHNKAVGGVDKSLHTKGQAADIRAESSNERFLIVRALIKAGFKSIGIYKNFVHADTRKKEVMWHG